MIHYVFEEWGRLWIGLLVWLIFPIAGAGVSFSKEFTEFHEWQILEVKNRKPISFEELKTDLLVADAIYIGEEHYTPSHIEAALRVLKILLAENREPVLAMEMFSWNGQGALERYVSGEIEAEDQFLQESRWKDNWGGKYEGYKPLVAFAKEQSLSLFALNPPRDLVRKVALAGLEEASRAQEMRRWNLDPLVLLDDPEYHEVVFGQIEQCHPNLPQEVYQRIYEASIFRDEGMAKIIVDYFQNRFDRAKPLVSYTGGGHVQYGVPIPNRVRRRLSSSIQQVTLYLHAFDINQKSEVWEMIQGGIADYIWLTPLGPNGSQPRCGA